MNYVIIVAGGSGSRMRSDIPKQFLLLNDRPVLMHTISAFNRVSEKLEILLVLNISFHSYWEDLCRKHNFSIPHTLVPGGAQRFDSVKNALSLIENPSLVAIHDAVRPVVTEELIERCFNEAKKTGTAIPVVPSRDSLRIKKGNTTEAISRDNILIVQTPQVFRLDILKEAYEQSYHAEFTDDASVVEKAGYQITAVDGEFQNLKITYVEDLEIASLFLKKRA